MWYWEQNGTKGHSLIGGPPLTSITSLLFDYLRLSFIYPSLSFNLLTQVGLEFVTLLCLILLSIWSYRLVPPVSA